MGIVVFRQTAIWNCDFSIRKLKQLKLTVTETCRIFRKVMCFYMKQYLRYYFTKKISKKLNTSTSGTSGSYTQSACREVKWMCWQTVSFWHEGPLIVSHVWIWSIHPLHRMCSFMFWVLSRFRHKNDKVKVRSWSGLKHDCCMLPNFWKPV